MGWRSVWAGLRRHAALYAVAVLSLALAVGANTAIFNVWYTLMRHRLPVQAPDRLVEVYNLAPSIPGTGYMRVSHLDYLDYASHTNIFSGTYSLYQAPVALGTRGQAVQVTADVVGGGYFDVLGVNPEVGSLFHADQTSADGRGALVVLSHDFFERRFGGNRAVVGATVTLNGTDFTVVGVAPAAFTGTGKLQVPDLWAPMSMHQVLLPGPLATYYMARNAQFFSVVGRLRPGVTVAQAQAAVHLLGDRLAREYPKTDALLTATATPLTASGLNPGQSSSYALAFALMLAVVGLVLLIACANMAHLLLARAQARQRELAVRMALGAGRQRLLRHLLFESLLLAAAAGLLGLLLAVFAGRELWIHRPAALQGAAIHPDFSLILLGFTLAMVVLTTLLFGLVPSLHATRVDPMQALRGLSGAPGGRPRLRGLLVAAEVAFSMAALILAGLFVASLRQLRTASPGFMVSHLATAHFDFSATGLSLSAAGAPERLVGYERALLERAGRIPGVVSAALASGAPMAAITGGRGYQVYGEPAGDTHMRVTNIESIAPGSFFRTMGIPLLQGRDFLSSDNATAPRVMIVNQTLAHAAWPGENPIGKRVLFHDEDAPTLVVGVARDSTYNSLAEGPIALAYLPLAQEPATAMALAVRTAGPPTEVLETLRRTILAVNSELAITHLEPAAQALRQSLWAARMGATLLGLLSALATLLAALGIYGVAAYEVRQRRRELGIRVALGAGPAQVFALVLRRGLTPVLLGLAAGIAAAVMLAHLATSLLFGIQPADPGVITGYAALFLSVALAALVMPARVATGADPAVILKENAQ